jgi:hypothetical protein
MTESPSASQLSDGVEHLKLELMQMQRSKAFPTTSSLIIFSAQDTNIVERGIF